MRRFYDYRCQSCDWKAEQYVTHGTVIPCPTCGSATERYYPSKASAVADDSKWVDGVTLENVGPTPVTVYSRQQYNTLLKERGFENFVRHMPYQGSDKSPHTTNWAVMSPVKEEDRLAAWWADEDTRPEGERIKKGQ